MNRQSPVLDHRESRSEWIRVSDARGAERARTTSSQPIRVCFLLDRLLPAGTEMQVLTLIKHLDRSAVQPYLCLLDGEDEISRSLEPTDCPVLRLGSYALRSPKIVWAAIKFARFLRREKIDILQVYFIQSATFGATMGTLAGTRHVVRVRNNVGHWITPKMVGRFRWVNRLVARIITNSEAGRLAVVEQEGVCPGSVTVLANGIDFDRFPSRLDQRHHERSGARRVGIVANLRRVKGLDVFVAAAARVLKLANGVQFLIAGDVDGEEDTPRELKAQVAGLGIEEHVHFLGRVADIPSFLSSLDVAVLSSRAEGTSNSLIEYMASGLPIVATAVGGNCEIIKDGVSGILVPPDDPDRLGAAICEILRDRPRSSAMAGAAFLRVREQFSSNRMAERYVEFYRSLRRPEG
jgi:glycosyltransferase involved in cell wall biosynthesis